jgi:hypothetical protein
MSLIVKIIRELLMKNIEKETSFGNIIYARLMENELNLPNSFGRFKISN